MTVAWEGPSPWTIGRCAECRQPIHFLAAEVIVHIEGGGRSYHRKCWRAVPVQEKKP